MVDCPGRQQNENSIKDVDRKEACDGSHKLQKQYHSYTLIAIEKTPSE
jgi:hypothetical protein